MNKKITGIKKKSHPRNRKIFLRIYKDDMHTKLEILLPWDLITVHSAHLSKQLTPTEERRSTKQKPE